LDLLESFSILQVYQYFGESFLFLVVMLLLIRNILAIFTTRKPLTSCFGSHFVPIHVAILCTTFVCFLFLICTVVWNKSR
jgi:hypothetical protein